MNDSTGLDRLCNVESECTAIQHKRHKSSKPAHKSSN